MKKTVKRFLTAALTLTMIIGVFAMQASAHPEDTKDYTIMNQDMSTIYNWLMNDMTWGDLEGQMQYADGSVWGSPYGIKTDTQISYNGGVNILAGTWTVGNGKAEANFSRKIFVPNQITDNNDVTFTYDIKTGKKYEAAALNIFAYINDMNGAQLFGYNPQTLTLGFGGRGNYTFDFADDAKITLAEETEYTLTVKLMYDEENGCYDLAGTVTSSGSAVGETVTVDNYTRAGNGADFKSVGFCLWTYTSIAETTPVTVFTVKNIKIEKTVKGDIVNFGDIKYDNDGIMLDEKMGDLDVAAINTVTTADTAYLNETTWANASAAGQWGLSGITKTDGEYFWAITSSSGTTTNKMTKKFDPVPAGGKLTFTGTFKTNNPGGKDYAVTLVLGNDDLSSTVSVIRFYEQQYNGFYFSSLGTNDGASAWSSSNGNIFLSKNWNINLSTSPLYTGTEIPFTFTMTPNAEDSTKYDLSITTGVGGAYTATSQIDKATAESFNTVGIYIYNNWYDVAGNFMGLKNLKITTEGTKTALVAGNNTVYLPIENVTGHAVDFALIAAVCDKTTDAHKAYFVETYDEHCKGADNLAIDVEITDPATEYVKLYVWDSFNNLVPYTEPISTK